MAFNYSINEGVYTGVCNNIGEWFNILEQDGGVVRNIMRTCTLTGAPSNLYGIFQNCPSLRLVDLSNLDTSNVVDMSYLFAECYDLESIDLTSCDTSNVTNMSSMFKNCLNLKTIKVNKATWNINPVTVETYDMFSGCDLLPNFDYKYTDGTKATDKSLGGYLDVVTAPTKYYKYYEHYSDGVKVIPKSTDMFEFITQEMYDQITPDPDMLYFIIEEE